MAATNLTLEHGKELATSLTQATFGTFQTVGQEGSARYPESYSLGKEQMSSCGQGSYDREAPTPQNLLCEEQSPDEIVRAALPPPMAAAPGPPQPPVVTFWTPASTATLYILLLDRSNSMDINRRWRNLHNALALFLDNLPNGDSVAVITFDRTAKTNLSPILLTSSNRAGVHGRIPGKPGVESKACLQCALKRAAKLAEGYSGRTQGILVTANTDAVLRRANLPTAVLLLGGAQGNPFTEMPLAKVYSLPEQSGNTNEDIYNILSLIHGTKHIKFFTEQVEVESNSSAEGKFTVEEGLRSALSVTSTTTMTEDIEEFTLTSPSGQLFQFPVVKSGSVGFTYPLQEAEEGIWSWRVKLTPLTLDPSVPVRVSAYAKSSRAGLELEGWWGEVMEGEGAAVRLYARLTWSSMPVTGARVTAIVNLPDGGTVEVELTDDGATNPDMMEGDSIYSGYFFQYAEVGGWYSLQLTAESIAGTSTAQLEGWAESPVCGNMVAETKLVPTGPFTRHAAAASLHSSSGAVYVIREGVPARKDAYPPSRVTDLRVEGEAANLSLVWTAPGGDFTQGRVETYSVRWAEGRDQLLKNFWEQGKEVDEEVGEPEMAGKLESLDLAVLRTNSQLYYALVATDREGHTSHVSNIVSVFVPEELQEEAAPRLSPSPSSLPLAPLTANLWVFILSGSLGGVGLIVLLSVICFVRRSRRKERLPKLAYLTEEAPYYLATPEPRDTKPSLVLPPVSWTFQHSEAPYTASSSSYSSSASSDTSSNRDLKAESGGLDRDSITQNSLRFSVDVGSGDSPQSRLSVDRDSVLRLGVDRERPGVDRERLGVDRERLSHNLSPHGRQQSDCLTSLGQQQKMKRRESFV